MYKIFKNITRHIIYLFSSVLAPFYVLKGNNYHHEVTFVLISYHGRFEHFKKIISQLDKFYPEVKKIIFLNGRDDNPSEQEKFLNEAREFLSKFGNLTLFTNDKFTCQSKLWNQGMITSTTNKVIILNDSVTILGPLLNKKLLNNEFVKINNSYSNYLISKKTIAKIGWFDENFIAGASLTDGDIETRLVIEGIELKSIRSPFIYWKKFENKVTWNPNLGGVQDKKTSHYNNEYFLKKWSLSPTSKTGYVYVPITSSYIKGPNEGYETPNPYPEILNSWQ